MILHNIVLINFRNFQEEHVVIDDASTVFLIGENGQGKTNFLESLYYLGYGTSFRAKREEHVVNYNENFYRIKGTFMKDSLKHTIEIHYTDRKKNILFNGTRIKNRREILHHYPCLIFKYTDIQYVMGGPEYQREYLDQVLFLNHSKYIQSFQHYKKTLLQKNACLKQEDTRMIPIFNETLAVHGHTIMKYRRRLVEYLNQYVEDLFSEVFGKKEKLALKYKPNWKVACDTPAETAQKHILSILQNNAEEEQRFKMAVSGPHRDAVKILLHGKEAKNYASTGQIRLISLLLRLLQAQYYYTHNDVSMIYLFDDVLLEIDPEKQQRFLTTLPTPQQSFFTFLPQEKLSRMIQSNSKKFYYIKEGHIIETTEKV